MRFITSVSVVILIYMWFSPLARAQLDQTPMLEASLKATQSLLSEANDRVARLSANGEILSVQVKKLQAELDKLKADGNKEK